MTGDKISVRAPGFRGLIWTQALGAFNDNAFKTLIALWVVASLPPADSSRLIAFAGALFVLPFILFSTFAGTLADRYSKKKLIVLLKGAELVLMAFAFVALYTAQLPLLLALLLLMGTQSAFFSPVKFAILPELLEDRELSHGNGLVQMTTFLAILLGTVAAGLLVEGFGSRLHLGAGLFMIVAAAGLFASLRISDVEPAGGKEPLRLNFMAQAVGDLARVRRYRGVFLALMGTAYFWFIGAMLQMNLLVYGKQLMGLSEAKLSLFQIVVAVGIGAGSYAAGRLSREQVELGLVPVGALGLVLFSLDLAFSFRSTGRTLADLLLLGASAGCFVIPLQTYVQQRSPEEQRGKFIAAGNIVSFAAVLAASGTLWALSDLFRLHPGQVFLVCSLMTLAVAVYIIRMLPDFLLRLAFYPVANLLYRIEVEGGENVPLRGPVLLVANHVSHVDALLISAATRRLVRFLMYRPYYEHPLLNPLVRVMGCIPISAGDSPRDMLASFGKAREALQRGEVVCIFAEGEVTRHGQMLRFKKGFERIVKGLNAPIVPVHLDRVWGSIFSFERGRFFFKRPRRLPYPVTVSFGAALPPTTPAGEVRNRILDLGSAAFRHRLAGMPPLPVAFMREAKRHPFRFAMADSTGRRLRFGGALAQAYVLGRAIVRSLPPCDAVGLLLPPTAAAALANVGAAMAGKVTVNLNYSASPQSAEECAARARVGGIVTSRRFLDKLGWDPSERMLFIEDIAAGISRPGALLAALGLWLLPAFLVERSFLRRARGPLDRTATIIFTSGSTGKAKGVMLTHANVLANIEGLGQVFQVSEEDRMVGVLPFFHSFGHTATLWFPLLAGFGVVYHFTPLDAKKIGELAERYGATFLLGTPTFLISYLRRIEPGQLRALRYAVVGAEKLREEVARAFEKRFGLLPLEGYGCTELSPVAAVNIPDFRGQGLRQRGTKLGSVGHPLPGVLIRVVDPDSGEELPVGEAGLLLVKGPNVMKGYLDDPGKTAEVLREGFYVTGDIAAIDEDGFVTITDRLSRFSKIAGEMVPHIKIEETLHALAGTMDQTFVVTAVPDEKKGERLVVLCRGYDDIEGLRRRLQDSGLPRLWVPARGAFHAVEEFPLLGSGKLDMRRLKELAKECDTQAR